MSEAKIELSVGGLSFAGEGEQDWLTEQLHYVLDSASKLSSISPPSPASVAEQTNAGNREGNLDFNQSLASYIKEKDGDSNQVKRFLATADWLVRRGNTELKTSTITKALLDARQKKLSNPADCLNQNMAKGFCEKHENGFFITPDGLKSLGHS